MQKAYKHIIIQCMILVILISSLVVLPKTWIQKTGLTDEEFDKEWSIATEEMLEADNPEERQLAMGKTQRLFKYQKYGYVGTTSNMVWVVIVTRFLVLVAILSLCWSIGRKIYREYQRPEPQVDPKLMR